MSDAVITALIMAAASIACQVLINAKSKREASTKAAVTEAQLQSRLERIEEKLDIHNGYASKFGDIQIAITKINKDIEYLKERKQ